VAESEQPDGGAPPTGPGLAPPAVAPAPFAPPAPLPPLAVTLTDVPPSPLAVTLTDVPPSPVATGPTDERAALRIDLAEPTPPPSPSAAEARSLDVAPQEPPSEPEDEPLVRPKPSPAKLAAIWLFVGCGVLALAQVPLVLSRHAAGSGSAAWVATSGAPSGSAVAASAGSAGASIASAAPPLAAGSEPPPFRVLQLEQDPELEITRAKVGKRGCEGALLAIGLEKAEIARVARALAPVRKITACRATDQLFVAATREGRKIRALEIELAPGELVQVRERGTAAAPAASVGAGAGVAATPPAADELVAERVTLAVTHRRQAVGLMVQTDLAAAVAAAGLDASILEPLDDAIESRGDLGNITRGAIFRIVADATYVGGRFDRYDRLVAFEYRPTLEGKPIRVYNLPEAARPTPEAKPPAPSYFDANGHQPPHGRWRMPLLIPRVTSRFNPRRMHPILHTIMPHNGCDFGAPSGTPVYAIGAGVVTFRGDSGPTGNFVSIRHDGGFESGYAHLSRFVPGVNVGTHVEGRQLVGYVGTTGRSTGPHLHLSVKLNGQFIDPLTLRLDAKKVVPPKQRDAFAKQRSDADAALDAIALPKPEKGEKAPAAAAASSGAPSASVSASGSADVDEIDDEHAR
jgi:murein DD-endopeptidase MepM/ murein hydrolase activator NlpD